MPDDEEPQPLLWLTDEEAQTLEQARVADNDEWAFHEADRLLARLPARTGGKDMRTESEVFDQSTLLVLHKLLVHGVLKSLDFPVATGKEANVFRGTTPRGGYLAVKIYRVNTATFKHVLQYIQGDTRFQGVGGDKRSLVAAWCQKEHRNLSRLRDAGVSVPEPVKALANVLVTEYLGKKEGAWPRMKEAPPLDPQAAYERCVEDYVTAYNGAGLVHADWSEYNVLLEHADSDDPALQRPRMIDVGQAVLATHPMAHEFLDRDVRNMVRYFGRLRVEAKPADVMGRLLTPAEAVGRGRDEEE